MHPRQTGLRFGFYRPLGTPAGFPRRVLGRQESGRRPRLARAARPPRLGPDTASWLRGVFDVVHAVSEWDEVLGAVDNLLLGTAAALAAVVGADGWELNHGGAAGEGRGLRMIVGTGRNRRRRRPRLRLVLARLETASGRRVGYRARPLLRRPRIPRQRVESR